MKNLWRKKIWWCFALVAYALTVAGVYAALQLPDAAERLKILAANISWTQEAGRVSLLVPEAGSTDLKGAMLLPAVGAGDRLPGLPAIWEYLSAGAQGIDPTLPPAGFDVMQGVRDLAEFGEGFTSDLYLGEIPLEGIRYGDHFYLRTSRNVVQVIACDDPKRPRLAGRLPYERVKQMAARDGKLYLLLGAKEDSYPRLIEVSLDNHAAPRELAWHALPQGAFAFAFGEENPVIFQKERRPGGQSRDAGTILRVLRLTSGGQLETLDELVSSTPGENFLANDDLLILADARDGLLVIDYRKPSRSEQIRTLPLADGVRYMMRSGDRLFAQGESGRIHIIDLADPQNPQEVFSSAEINHTALLKFVDDATYYFTSSGQLLVYDQVPAARGIRKPQATLMATGVLLPQTGGPGFTLLGQSASSLPAVVTEAFPLADADSLQTALFWRNHWLVLRDDGLLQAYRPTAHGEPVPTSSLRLPSGQRWLVASSQRLYVGGGREVLVVDAGEGGRLELTSRLALQVDGTWAAAFSRHTLWLAAGPHGLLAFSLADPDRLVGLKQLVPALMTGLADVRQLAATGDGRVFAAAGRGGLLCFNALPDGRISLYERLDFGEPVVAVGLIAGTCLVATTRAVHVVDTGTTFSMQKLGRIALPGVERLVMAPPHHWAGLVGGRGWRFLPAPIRLVPEAMRQADGLKLALPAQLPVGEYIAFLYNDAGMKAVAGNHIIEPSAQNGLYGTAHGDD